VDGTGALTLVPFWADFALVGNVGEVIVRAFSALLRLFRCFQAEITDPTPQALHDIFRFLDRAVEAGIARVLVPPLGRLWAIVAFGTGERPSTRIAIEANGTGHAVFERFRLCIGRSWVVLCRICSQLVGASASRTRYPLFPESCALRAIVVSRASRHLTICRSGSSSAPKAARADSAVNCIVEIASI